MKPTGVFLEDAKDPRYLTAANIKWQTDAWRIFQVGDAIAAMNARQEIVLIAESGEELFREFMQRERITKLQAPQKDQELRDIINSINIDL